MSRDELAAKVNVLYRKYSPLGRSHVDAWTAFREALVRGGLVDPDCVRWAGDSGGAATPRAAFVRLLDAVLFHRHAIYLEPIWAEVASAVGADPGEIDAAKDRHAQARSDTILYFRVRNRHPDDQLAWGEFTRAMLAAGWAADVPPAFAAPDDEVPGPGVREAYDALVRSFRPGLSPLDAADLVLLDAVVDRVATPPAPDKEPATVERVTLTPRPAKAASADFLATTPNWDVVPCAAGCPGHYMTHQHGAACGIWDASPCTCRVRGLAPVTVHNQAVWVQCVTCGHAPPASGPIGVTQMGVLTSLVFGGTRGKLKAACPHAPDPATVEVDDSEYRNGGEVGVRFFCKHCGTAGSGWAKFTVAADTVRADGDEWDEETD